MKKKIALLLVLVLSLSFVLASCFEHSVGSLCNKSCNKKRKRSENEHDRRNDPVYVKHKHKCSDDGEDARKELSEAEKQAFRELVGIVYNSVNDIALRLFVKVGEGKLLYGGEGVVSDVAQNLE